MKRPSGWLATAFLLLALGACSRGSAVAAHPAQEVAPAAAPTAAPTIAAPPASVDFATEARLLFRVVACAGDEPLPAAFDPAVVEEHCQWLKPRFEAYRRDYLGRLTPFLAAHRPAELPPNAVYPFGGGDLLSALATYPELRDVTTLSLEHAGDPRRIKELDGPRLRQSLKEIEKRIRGLFAYNESTSENLMQAQRGDIPGQIAFFLVALAAHGYEPVALRYFRLGDDGSVHYVTKEELAAEEGKKAQRLNNVWVSPDFSEVFSNSELAFSRSGEAAGAAPRVHRHIAANLADDHLKKFPGVLNYLDTKGKVAAMTKAASYLLWAEGFSLIRKYLVDHMVFMVSDSTGLPPSVATRAGFVMETYGRYKGPFLAARGAVAEEYLKLWSEQPYRELDFRYGYPDVSGAHHLVITRPASPLPASAAVTR